jgi:hypothetical protein
MFGSFPYHFEISNRMYTLQTLFSHEEKLHLTVKSMRELMIQVSNTVWFDLHCIKILMATQLTDTHQMGKY